MDIYYILKRNNQVYYLIMLFFNIIGIIYNNDNLERCYRYLLLALINFRSFTLIQTNIKFIYYLIWTRLYIYPIFIIYNIYAHGLDMFYMNMYMLLDIVFNIRISKLEFGNSPFDSSLIPMYYSILFVNNRTLSYNEGKNRKLMITQGIIYILFSIYHFIYGEIYTYGYYLILGLQYIAIGLDGAYQFLVDASIVERLFITPLLVYITGTNVFLYDDLYLSLFMGGLTLLNNENVYIKDYIIGLIEGGNDSDIHY